MQPIKMEFELGGHLVVPDRHPIMLDALLLALDGRRHALPFKPDLLPLQSISTASWRGNEFVWMASALEVNWMGPATDRYLSRNARSLEILDDAKTTNIKVIDSSRGMSKLARKRIMVRQASMATAWCVGDLAQIEALLGELISIGAQRHLGFGAVRAWRTQIDEAALERAWMRPIPGAHPDDPYKERRLQIQGRSSPPYWDRNLSLQSWWPSDAIKISADA